MAIERGVLEARIGPKAAYYLRRFEAIDAGRRVGWNWPAFFLSTAWFSYRGMVGWAMLNLAAPYLVMLLAAFTFPFSVIAGAVVLIVYPVVFFLWVPLYADALYYERIKKEIGRSAAAGKYWSPTRPFLAVIVGVIAVVVPAAIVVGTHLSDGVYVPRAQVSEAISLMSGARTPVAEYFVDKGKWPDNLKQVAENTSGKYTERVEITSGAGAASGALVMTATMKASGVGSQVAGKTVQMRSEDGKNWSCTRGAVNGVEDKYLPAACR